MVSRRVVVVFGPPGAGKTTYARGTGLTVYDRDDPEWGNSEAKFRAALRRLATDPAANAVVIRTGATPDARKQAIAMCAATETIMLTTPPDVCEQRVRQRGRGDIASQIKGIQSWWSRYGPATDQPTTLQPSAGITSREW